MIYEQAFNWLLVILIVGTIVRMCAQGFLYAVKLEQPFWKGCIPFVSAWKLHTKHAVHGLHLWGSVLRIVGFGMVVGVVFGQYYEAMVQMTHMYGLYFQTYEPVDHSTMWTLLSYTGVLMTIAGCVVRFFASQSLSIVFSKYGFLNGVGALVPTLYYLILAVSKTSVYLLKKPTKLMSHEEYQLYCALTEE
ncbi:MAG: hypothetical protein IJZ68_09105 [Bacteroidaceae bacterium]|nr:hypothetical protein [Bacteroidaceae bacterium]